MRRGLSLLEVLVVLALLGILAALAVPAYGRWRAQAELNQAARSLTWAFQQARAEAKRTATPRCVTVFPAADGQAAGWSMDQTCPSQGPPQHPLRGVKLTLTSPQSASFSPPYGTVDFEYLDFPLQHASRPDLTRTVRVLGVTGKVVVW
ncbi:prepilin-type N-terminal cleavage/methylation domain-containing protein [Thermus scotoductus]|uniref:Prepilin-type cleavage/methylation domain-containing protein n=1 Tax=Thermus scotoductus TaxID=37636 RepID=A0A430RTZ3_THESC|nr:prepilin-type N-terminal cleavage/methylation domain-containing protein [Thermus scotoductus]RTG92022.1 prepilin-type cleavage/methylation domain-containing protein [Thermus scotoductus]RTH03653.1 prepilin-type cleavage/methylation domain-containing protein [Thermus scotoductus]RTH23109.1 prepilin-type cleavage/methylation domain-containing protein [Thermus scotoductus]RTH97132.1 prepilin-type cleavage/methylation domain-containing protein [Thermus scotoductus]